MDELPGNSYKAQAKAATPSEAVSANGKGSEETEKVEKIIIGTVTERKKPLGKRFVETFFGGQAKDAVNYSIFEVLIPAARDMLLDAVNGGLERLVKGSDTRRGISRPGVARQYFSYDRVATRPGFRPDPREAQGRRVREEHDFTDVVFSVRSDAEAVIDRMFDRINEYNEVTLAYVKKLVGETANFTDQSWGWTDIRGSHVERIGPDQYIVVLPKTEHLSRNR